MFGSDAQYTVTELTLKFVENCSKNPAIKHTVEKSFLLNFLNLSENFRLNFSEETYFHFQPY